MKLYGIKIQKSHLALIALLNAGVTPEIEKTPTWFIFDATWNSEVPNKIVTDREFLQTCEIKGWQPMLLAIR
jgi:hypothetical protein